MSDLGWLYETLHKDGKTKGTIGFTVFLKSKELPEPVSPAFVKALQEVLSGLQPVMLGGTDLQAALSEGGLPCTISDLRERFDRYIANLTKGKDASKVRVLIE